MRSVSLIAIGAALALSFSAPTFAQSAAGTAGATVGSSSQTGTDVNAGGTSVSVDGGASVDTDVSATLEGDTDGDGTISVEEQATIDAELDADGDGIVSDAERAAGNTAVIAGSTDDDGEGVCPAPEYSGSAEISAEDMTVLEAATTAQFIIVDDCEDGGSLVSGDSENDAGIEAMISANAALTTQIAGRGIGEIIGVSIEGDAVTIYAESNEGDDDADAATSAVTTTGGDASTGATVEASGGATVQSQ